MPKTEVKDSQIIFSLFTALNGMGYNDENNPRGMSSIRKKVRGSLRGRNLKIEYSGIAKAFKQHHPWYLLYKVLTSKTSFLVKSVKKFSSEPTIKNLWKKIEADRLKQNKKVAPIFKQEASRMIKFFNKPARLKKIILINNPLDAYWRGYSMKMGSIDYVIVGPGAEKNQGELIRHELMHLLAPSFHLPQKVVTPRLSATTFSYIGYKVQNRECVIRALNLIYQKEVLKTNIKSLIAREKKSFPYIEKANTLLEGKLKKRSYF